MLTYDFSDMLRNRDKYIDMFNELYEGMLRFDKDAETFCARFKDVLYGMGRSNCIYTIKRYHSFIWHFRTFRDGNELFLKEHCFAAKKHKSSIFINFSYF